MKNLKDLFDLILKETELNNGKQCTFHFSVDTKHQWVSMYQCHNLEGVKDNTIFCNLSIKSESELQLVYWTIFNNGRSRDLK